MFLTACQSKLKDDFPAITWLMGFIEENSKNIKLEIVKNEVQKLLKIYLKKAFKNTTV